MRHSEAAIEYSIVENFCNGEQMQRRTALFDAVCGLSSQKFYLQQNGEMGEVDNSSRALL